MAKENGNTAQWAFNVDRISVEDVANFLDAMRANQLNEQVEIMARYVTDAPAEALSAEGLVKLPFKEFLRGRDQFGAAVGDLSKN